MGMVKAILGGTFDPIHIGHIKIAEHVQEALSVDEVIFIPAGQPYFKVLTPVTEASLRLKMVELAIENRPGMSVSDIEINRKGPTYTVDTIRELRLGMNEDDELYFIMGWDNLLSFDKWREPQEILRLCKLVVVPRPGYEIRKDRKLSRRLKRDADRIILLDQPVIDISSTGIREQILNGADIETLVPPRVADYIRSHDLYNE